MEDKQLYITLGDVQIQRRFFSRHDDDFFQHASFSKSYSCLTSVNVPLHEIYVGDTVMKSGRSLLVSYSLLSAAIFLGSYHSRAHAAEDASEKTRPVSSQCCEVDRADDVWLISTRHLGCPSWNKMNEIELHIEHYDGKGIGWIESSLDEFLASSNPAQPTMFYLHGNRVELDDAINRGWRVRNTVLGCSRIEPIRFVIWTWPSDRIHGQYRDVMTKVARANVEAHYLAWLLSQLDSATPLRILGVSLGCRVTTGALHLLGGGVLHGQTLPPGQVPRVRVALLAAAIHNYWLQPGAYHGSALSQMDRLLIQYNSCDPVLKRYEWIEKNASPSALGYTGMYIDEPLGVWIDQRDVCCIVGKSHAEARYINSPTLTDEVREALFGG